MKTFSSVLSGFNKFCSIDFHQIVHTSVFIKYLDDIVAQFDGKEWEDTKEKGKAFGIILKKLNR